MASIEHLEMSAALAALPEISVKKSFFGLKTDVIYIPTGSSVKVKINEYTTEMGDKLETILKANPDNVASMITKSNIEKANLGNVRLEACISDDKQFAAVQLLRFSQLNYAPSTPMVVLTGAAAEAIATLF